MILCGAISFTDLFRYHCGTGFVYLHDLIETRIRINHAVQIDKIGHEALDIPVFLAAKDINICAFLNRSIDHFVLGKENFVYLRC